MTLPAVGGSTSRVTGESPPSDNMRSIAVVVGDGLANETEQVSFTKHNDVIEQLAA
jgi:hypothetical protein